MVGAKVKIASLVILVVVVLSAGFLIASKPAEPEAQLPMTVTDDLGRKVTISRNVERIISLAPTNTEILYSLGLGDKVIGVTTYCDYPPEAKLKEKVGEFSTINIEKVVALKPDLVLSTGGEQEGFVRQLEGFGVTVLALYPEDLDGIMKNIMMVGEVAGAKDAAKRLTEQMEQRINVVANIVSKSGRPKVFYMVWDEPLMTAGQGTFPDSLITLAGGTNLGAGAGESWPIYSLETLVAQDPDVIVLATHGKSAESLKSLGGWNTMTAVKNGKVYLIDSNVASRSGPRIVDALENMARYIHPELFK